MLETLFPGVTHLQNIHPLAVHFPIAFLAGASLLYLLAWSLRRETLAATACALLILGALSAAAAAGTGLYSEDGVMIARSVRAHLLHEHKVYMFWTTTLSIVLAAWAAARGPFPEKRRWLFLLLLITMLTCLSLGSDLGARMVYGYNAGGDACPQPIEFNR
jgi:uncharacterized membrane protein